MLADGSCFAPLPHHQRNDGGAVQYTHTYGYDQVGNRILRNDGGSLSLAHGYDANDKLTMTRWVGGGPPGPITANFYYDGAGNMSSVTGSEFGGNWTMTYDDESRLKTVTPPVGSSENFTYNALGQRMKLSVNYVVTRYVYDGDRVLEETNDAGTVQARYTTAAGSYYAPLLHIWRVTDSLSRFPMYDLTGSVRGLLDAAGGVTDTYTLEAFGKQRASAGTTPNPYRCGGAWGYINGVSGLQQLGARFYWPELGRFIQQDPIGNGMNWYAYVGGNPVVWVDPEGLYSSYEALRDTSNFFAGVGDNLTFGLTGRIRQAGGYDYVVNRNSGMYKGGEWTGVGLSLATGAAGGLEAAGAKGAGKEFSHWLPKRLGGPRSIWNGNYVTKEVHALSDLWRYRFMPKAWKLLHEPPNVVIQQFVRIPNLLKGIVAGAIYGGASKGLSDPC